MHLLQVVHKVHYILSIFKHMCQWKRIRGLELSQNLRRNRVLEVEKKGGGESLYLFVNQLRNQSLLLNILNLTYVYKLGKLSANYYVYVCTFIFFCVLFIIYILVYPFFLFLLITVYIYATVCGNTVCTWYSVQQICVHT